jgi:hypothetical protein
MLDPRCMELRSVGQASKPRVEGLKLTQPGTVLPNLVVYLLICFGPDLVIALVP